MKRRVATFKQLRFGILPVALLLVLVIGALLLLSDSIGDAEHFTRLYSTLFAINLVIVVALLVLIGFNIQRVFRQYRRGITGSRLTVRLVSMFVVLSILPVSVVYYVSYRFINHGIDSWFDVRVEQALSSSLELSRNALDVRMRELTGHAKKFVHGLADTPNNALAWRLEDMRAESGAAELSVFTSGGRVLATASSEAGKFLPERPEESILMQVRGGHSYAGLDTIPGSGLFVRIVLNMPSARTLHEPRIFQALFPVTERMSRLADAVQNAYTRYQELAYLRGPLKFSFTLTLSLVLLLSVLAAVWAAFVSAQRLVEPIRVLTLGTRAVAEGNYDKRLIPQTHDELGALVESFNDMTEKIALARDEASRSQNEAEGERAYLKAVLGSLSSGVLTFDRYRTLRTFNAAATGILATDLREVIAHGLDELRAKAAHLESFSKILNAHLRSAVEEWHEEVPLFGPGGRRVLLCRGRRLPSSDSQAPGGFVVVFDDITTLLQAERDAAWREVARRIAHEIKNPLTPIQLSAERMRHKLMDALDASGAEVLDRSTHTIIQQVEALKQMVKAFSEYARMPRMEPRPLNLNTLVNEVLDLYRVGVYETRFVVELDPRVGNIEADSMRLRQVLNNLVRNAIDATKNLPQACIMIGTRWVDDAPTPSVELRIEDTGPGIPQDLMANLFEPYVTTKPKGTGLGLAIVKKIVDEHGGMVWAANRNEGGAGVYVRLPLTAPQRFTNAGQLRRAIV